jgi:hypothetical protein
MMRPMGRVIVGSKCYICASPHSVHLGFTSFLEPKIEAYCESCFYCISEVKRIKISNIEYESSTGPTEYEIILEYDENE